MQKALIIEDDKIKIEKLSSFFERSEVTIRESYHSGLKEIRNNHSQYDFLILDMTIPLWDKMDSNYAGNYEQFGGERILREMKRRKLQIPTILVTMFDVFPTSEGNLNFKELNRVLYERYEEFYLGAVFYNASDNEWKEKLSSLIKKI